MRHYDGEKKNTVCEHEDGSPVKLGQGGFGAVYKALQDGVRIVAVKISNNDISLKTSRNNNAFWREIELIASCRDRNILQFYGAAVNGPEVLLVTEFCDRGDLYHAISDQETEHVEGELCWYNRGKGIALDVARGLFSLHSRRIVHLDVKSLNVLLTQEYLAKVADVGVTIAADIWSFGVIMWELLTGERPRRGLYRDPLVPEEGPASAVELMRACMEEDPLLRPTAGEIVTILQRSD
ncbi:hypothetical protein WJX73_010306 [Symbiochloris irregularis]|uniref:Protein kinase domain-containing protein n=1 Tax=Symbiochloris irregularis TaxID=706552 RepID=A0AAW1NQC4_9CHLO